MYLEADPAEHGHALSLQTVQVQISWLLTTTNFRTAQLEVVWWRQRPQGGGQDAEGEKHRQISHGLVGAQRVGVGGSNQLTLTNRVSKISMAGWP